MAVLDHIAHALISLLAAIAGFVLAALAAIEDWLRGIMTHAGIPPDLQTVVGILIAVAFLVAAFRLFGGFIRVVLIVVLVAVVAHALTHGSGKLAIPGTGAPAEHAAH
jgi:hypothetical protein